ncbi:MAG: hypothetical protein WCJ51_02995 [Candidatus Moraniibacteriota bacterium]
MLEYKKFRVRTAIKSFRDLDVYKNTTMLSADIFRLKLPEKYRKSEKIKKELDILYDLSKNITRLIAESYGEKFTDLKSSLSKLEMAAQICNLAISKLDFLTIVIDEPEFRGLLLGILNKYPPNKLKILNLKKAWDRVWGASKKSIPTH